MYILHKHTQSICNIRNLGNMYYCICGQDLGSSLVQLNSPLSRAYSCFDFSVRSVILFEDRFCWLIDWLIDWIEFYAVSAIFQPFNGVTGFLSLKQSGQQYHFHHLRHRKPAVWLLDLYLPLYRRPLSFGSEVFCCWLCGHLS